MDGPNAERLRLVLKHNQMVHQMANNTVLLIPRYETLWEGRSDVGDKWLAASVLYSHGQAHQVKRSVQLNLDITTMMIVLIHSWLSRRWSTIRFRVNDDCEAIS